MADFNEIYNRYFSDAYKYLALRVYDQGKIKEMLVKLFTYVYEKAEMEPMALMPFLPFMYNFCWKMIKDEPAASLKSAPVGPSRPVFYSDSYNMQSAGGEGPTIPQALLELVSHLTIEEREILWLKFFDELTDSEITKALQMHSKEAPRKIYNAMQKVREILVNSTTDGARHINYFGNVNNFFDNIKLSLNIMEDENLKAEVKAAVFAKQEEARVNEAARVVPCVTFQGDEEVVAEGQSTTEEAEPVSETPFYSDMEEDAPSFKELWRKIQGAVVAVFAILVISFVGTMIYLQREDIYSKVVYTSQFVDEEKSAFNNEILTKVLPQRDFKKATVEKSDSIVNVSVENKSGKSEAFTYKSLGGFKWAATSYKIL